MRIVVSKRTSFDAAHWLPNYIGKCNNIHGHHWIVEVAVSGEVDDQSGMVIDFTELKDFLESVKSEFDHYLINKVIENPTAENIIRHIYNKYKTWVWSREIELENITVWETEDSYAEYRK